MPDDSIPAPEVEPQAISVNNVSGGVNLDAQRDVNIGGDVVGRDKIVSYQGYTVEQVSTLLTQISSTFQPKPFDGRCPYLGLDAFSEDDADRFFGRETLIGELVARVKESRFVVIAGPSGSGKSSLVRAGLIHALKQGALSNSDRWLYATLSPGRNSIESLALAMSRMAKSPDAGKYLREHSTEPGALHDFVESQLSDRKDQRAVIFVDQFEEVFTQVSKEDERAAFLNLLTYAATTEGGRVTVLFAMRSDFVSNCATHPQLNALLNQQFMQVGAMQPDELVSAIARPALQVGLRIDPDLIAQIVNDMQDEPGALPLMQFALKDLFAAQQIHGGIIVLNLNDYLARGGLHKALERHADAAFACLNGDEQQLARTIFSGLIAIGHGTQNTRRTTAFDELVSTDVNAAEVKSVIQKLADARLITTDKLGAKDTVTIAHERLIGAWSWLRKLVNENRDAIVLQNQIAEDAVEWNEHQRDSSYLYSGARLATVHEQLVVKKIMLGGLARAFVQAGVDTAEAERQREEARRQRELDDARRAAKMAEARARAERRALVATWLLLAIAIVTVVALAAQPIYRFWLQQQALDDMASIPASRPMLGIEVVGDDQYLPYRVYEVPAFAIEKYEVTNARYSLCVRAGACVSPISSSSEYTASERANYPVTNVTFGQARDFCNWLGRRLPTEFEWECAARGVEARLWPWNDPQPPTSLERANLSYGAGTATLQPVGRALQGMSPDGVYDLAGNVWEWSSSPYEVQTDAIQAEPTIVYSVRGGGANLSANSMPNIAMRLPAEPLVFDAYIGFRCAESR